MCYLSKSQRQKLANYLNQLYSRPRGMFYFSFRNKYYIHFYDYHYSFDESVLIIYVSKNDVHLGGRNKNYERFYKEMEDEIKRYLKSNINNERI